MDNTLLIQNIKAAFKLDTLISLDFETFYGKGYGLKNKTYAEYIMDDRFRAQMLGVGEDDEDIEILDAHELDEWAANIRARRLAGERIGVIAQNTQFDAAILCWRFGIVFDFYFDAMLLSRLRFINRSAALKAHAERIWPEDESRRKGDELHKAEGIEDLHSVPGLFEGMSTYCTQDVALTRDIVLHHWATGQVPMAEWYLMHITLRGCVEPQVWINQPLLDEVVVDDAAEKLRKVTAASDYLESLGKPPVGSDVFASNDKYKALLADFGAKLPYKLDPETYEMKPALGKTDPEYVKFQQDNPQLEPLFAARETVKSTIATSRAKRLQATANLLPLGGFIPFPLNYHKAHTGRWSGGEKLNLQNLQRGSKHRLCLTAKDGYVITVRDLSGIEMRMNLWFCEQDDLLELVGKGGDIYCKAAEGIYAHPVNKKEHPLERQVGKVATLGLGYQMSWKTFQATMAGGPMGMDPIFFPDSFCKQVKDAYDRDNPMIKQMWAFLGNVVIPAMCDPMCDMDIGRHGCVKVRYQKLILPSGRELQYPSLHCHAFEHARGMTYEYRYDDGTRNRFKEVVWKRIYGGALLENIIQAIARDVIADHMIKIEDLLCETASGWVIGSVHDEILSMVLKPLAEQRYEQMGTIMSTPPSWCYDLPLASEGGWDTVYSK
jgi:DNA polymerase